MWEEEPIVLTFDDGMDDIVKTLYTPTSTLEYSNIEILNVSTI